MPVRGNPVLIPQINQDTFPLFSLPFELRGLIYFEALRTGAALKWSPRCGRIRRSDESRRIVKLAPEIEQMSALLCCGAVSCFTTNCIRNGVKLYCFTCKGRRVISSEAEVAIDLAGAWQGNQQQQQQQQTGVTSRGSERLDLSGFEWCRCTESYLDFLMISKRVFREALPIAWQANMMYFKLRNFLDAECQGWTLALRMVPYVQVSHIRRVVLDVVDDDMHRLARLLSSVEGKEFLNQLASLHYLRLIFDPVITSKSVEYYVSYDFLESRIDLYGLKTFLDVLVNCSFTSDVAVVSGLLSSEVERWLEQVLTDGAQSDFDWITKIKIWISASMQEQLVLRRERQEEINSKDFQFNCDRSEPNPVLDGPFYMHRHCFPLFVLGELDISVKQAREIN